MNDQDMRAAALMAASQLKDMSPSAVLIWADKYYNYIRMGTHR